jgi:hypothetical protein
MSDKQQQEFQRLAEQRNQPNFVVEFWEFLRHNKKWWLAPIVVALLLLCAFILLSGTAAAPFIYPFF